LKRAANSFLKKLNKYNVMLTKTGEIDYSKVTNINVINEVKANESLVKLTLMQADLEFEYP
jgi:hypothetical protein